MMIDGFKVFSATKYADRIILGEMVTEWLQKTKVDIVDKWVLQSSDNEFHCLTIVVSYRFLEEIKHGDV